ncbi:WD40 repeat-like protein [Pleurotus eryngii]|uniref:WD40 repeat-like protein n=1 Tax=Pleurotus eryngii TaxID=5323 RepID=A0A9P6DI17_PLEER|nr:WD40 repeat-like protein [Pleurotus eryngii]
MVESRPQILPISTIHPEFATIIAETRSGVIPGDTFWVSCYKSGEPSVHGKVKVELDENDATREKVSFAGQGGVEMREVTGDGYINPKYAISCPALSIHDAPIALPYQEYADPQKSNPERPQRITTFDVSPDNTQFATGFLDGTVGIYPILPETRSTTQPISASPYTSSRAHLSSVTSLRFFPSSKVLLSGGADFTLHILPAALPSSSSSTPTRLRPARSLSGHIRAISNTAIIARGRNVLSSSLDGTIRLWDVGSGQAIRSLSSARGPILGMSLGERNGVAFGPASNTNGSPAINGADGGADEREVETQDKLVFCSLQIGTFECFDLGSRRCVFQSQRSSAALQTISYSVSHHLIATGSSHGVVNIYDVRSGLSGDSAPLVSFTRNNASIEDLCFTSSSSGGQGGSSIGLAIATSDGLPFIASLIDDAEVSVAKELVGIHCDGVRCLRSVGDEIWYAGDDGIVRRYKS